MTRFFFLFITLFLLSLSLPLKSFGYLGEQTSFRAQMRVQSSPSVVQMDEVTDTHGVVRELRWRGPTRPNFRATLGPCYEFYKSEMKHKARARGPGVITMENEKCRIKVGGGMGRIRGEAYLK